MAILSVVRVMIQGRTPVYYTGAEGPGWVTDSESGARVYVGGEAELAASRLNAEFLCIGLRFETVRLVEGQVERASISPLDG